jgi:uncharacterized membrane protein YqjE
MAVLRLVPVSSPRLENEEREGVVALIRETVDGLRMLIADHIKLARIELVADMQVYGRSVAVLVVAGLVLAIGYLSALVAVAFWLARLWGAPIGVGVVAAVHLLLGGIAVIWALGKMRRTRLMHETTSEAKSSVAVIAHRLQGRTS